MKEPAHQVQPPSPLKCESQRSDKSAIKKEDKDPGGSGAHLKSQHWRAEVQDCEYEVRLSDAARPISKIKVRVLEYETKSFSFSPHKDTRTEM